MSDKAKKRSGPLQKKFADFQSREVRREKPAYVTFTAS